MESTLTNIRHAPLPETVVSFLTGVNFRTYLGTSLNFLGPDIQGKLNTFWWQFSDKNYAHWLETFITEGF